MALRCNFETIGSGEETPDIQKTWLMCTNIVINGMNRIAILKQLEAILGNTWYQKYMIYEKCKGTLLWIVNYNIENKKQFLVFYQYYRVLWNMVNYDVLSNNIIYSI